MKRDWDTIRRILLKIEALPTEASQLNSNEIEGVDNEVAAYHMRLLLEAKLIEGACRDALGPAWCWAARLTWAGHEFLDQIRRDTHWQRIKQRARERAIDLSFESILALARQLLGSLL